MLSFQMSLVRCSRLSGPAQLMAVYWDSVHLTVSHSGKKSLLDCRTGLPWTLCETLGQPLTDSLHYRFLPSKLGGIILVLLSPQAWLFVQHVVHACCSSSPFLYVRSLATYFASLMNDSMDLGVVDTLLTALEIAHKAWDDERQHSMFEKVLGQVSENWGFRPPWLNKHLLSTYQARWLAKKLTEGAGRFVEVSLIQRQLRLSVIFELSNYTLSGEYLGNSFCLCVSYRIRDWCWFWKVIKWTVMGYYRDQRGNLWKAAWDKTHVQTSGLDNKEQLRKITSFLMGLSLLICKMWALDKLVLKEH